MVRWYLINDGIHHHPNHYNLGSLFLGIANFTSKLIGNPQDQYMGFCCELHTHLYQWTWLFLHLITEIIINIWNIYCKNYYNKIALESHYRRANQSLFWVLLNNGILVFPIKIHFSIFFFILLSYKDSNKGGTSFNLVD